MKRVLMATAKTHQIGNSPPRAGMHGPPTLQEVGLYKHQERKQAQSQQPHLCWDLHLLSLCPGNSVIKTVETAL